MKLKIGIITESEILPKYDQELIGWIQNNNEKYDLVLQINLSSNQKKKIGFNLIKNINSLSLRIIKRIENWYSRKMNLIEDYNVKYFDSSKIKKVKYNVTHLNNFNRVCLLDEDIEKIKKFELDIIIRCCGYILDGNILKVPKFGILSFHHGDNNNYRGGPPGFWEIYDKSNTSGFIIQKLDKNLDGGIKLLEGNFVSGINYAHNENILLKNSIFYFQNLLEFISKYKKLPDIIKNKPYNKKIYKTPNILKLLIYIIKIYPKLIKKFFFKILGNKKIWSVIYNNQSFMEDINFNNFIKIKNYKNTFLADPFIHQLNNKKYLFAEEYDFNRSLGSIVVYEIRNKDYERLGTCLKENFHLSYPYIFKYENEIYMIPETAEIYEIRIYKCIQFPLKWKFHKTIKKNLQAVDSMIFYKNNFWWLLTNISYNRNSNFSHLDIFYSDNPLSDNWTSHKMNPIIFDVNRSRNGGIIIDNNDVYRVNQSPSFTEYGSQLSINKLEQITPEIYEERLVKSIKPNFKDNLIGTHHFNSNGKIITLDYCENELLNKLR